MVWGSEGELGIVSDKGLGFSAAFNGANDIAELVDDFWGCPYRI